MFGFSVVACVPVRVWMICSNQFGSGCCGTAGFAHTEVSVTKLINSAKIYFMLTSQHFAFSFVSIDLVVPALSGFSLARRLPLCFRVSRRSPVQGCLPQP